MAENIVIKVGGNSFEGQLNESVTGRAIYDALPIVANGQRWGVRYILVSVLAVSLKMAAGT